MALFGNNWKEDGLYERDRDGEMQKLTTTQQVEDALERGTLVEKDCLGIGQIEYLHEQAIEEKLEKYNK